MHCNTFSGLLQNFMQVVTRNIIGVALQKLAQCSTIQAHKKLFSQFYKRTRVQSVRVTTAGANHEKHENGTEYHPGSTGVIIPI